MIRKFIRVASISATFIAAALVATPSHATPAFARQAGKACNTCHFQHYPALNEYGQEFKAGGFVDMGKQGTIKGKDMSLPEILNASIFTKIRHQRNNGVDLPNEPTAAGGEWQFPDEFALLFGGRVAENIGYMLEGQLANGAAPFLAGFKMPAMFKLGNSGTKIGIVPYTTDALGASYGFELLNTGAVRNVRIMEHRNESSAQQYLGTATAASGAAFVLWNPNFFVNLSAWSPNHVAISEGRANASPSSTYLRAAWTPTIGDWSLGAGMQWWAGESKVDETANPTGNGRTCTNAAGAAGTTMRCRTEAFAVDAQAQGTVGKMPLGLYLTHAKAPGNSATKAQNLFNTSANEKRATTVTAELGILPNKATLMLAQRWAKTGATPSAWRDDRDNATTLGGTYQYSQNLQLQLLYSLRDKQNGYQGSDTTHTATINNRGNRLITFMLSAGF